MGLTKRLIFPILIHGACQCGRRLALHPEGFVKPSRKEGAMVTYSDLFQFGILIVAIIGLVYKIAKK